MFFVNESCIGCGLCASICPEVFEMNDEGVSNVILTEVSTNLMPKAEEALENCPVSAIERK